MTRSKATPNGLFGAGVNWQANACVGHNGGPPGFQRLAVGFFAAAERLVAGLVEDAAGIDALVYPVVSNYRQGAELYLKHLARKLPPLAGRRPAVKPTHKLLDLWAVVRPLLEALAAGDATGLEDIRWAEQVLRAFAGADPDGACFRYPEDRAGRPYLLGLTHVNVEDFAGQMTRLREIFECWCSAVDSEYEALAQ